MAKSESLVQVKIQNGFLGVFTESRGRFGTSWTSEVSCEWGPCWQLRRLFSLSNMMSFVLSDAGFNEGINVCV